MTGILAVYAPIIGGATYDTFIRRHVQDLLPKKTVVITDATDTRGANLWRSDYPILELQMIPYARLKNKLIKKLFSQAKPQISARTLSAKRFLQHHHAKVLLSEFLPPSIDWIQICNELGIRIYAHAHGYDVSKKHLDNPEWREKYKSFNHADGIITVNMVSKQKLTEIGLDPNKIFVVPCGVDVPNETYDRQNRDVIRCLAVGRMVGKKAPVLLLDSFRRAVQKFPNLHLDYIGNGELFASVYHYVQAFNLNTKVTLHGSLPSNKVIDYIINSDIFIQHSVTDPVSGDQEGLPVAILEAMAHSLPVVSTYHTGIPEAVIHQQTGFLVEEGNTRLMAEYILELANNYTLRTEMGMKGWEQAKEKFTWELEKDKLLNILRL